MMLLTTGSSGPQTELLQTALNRAGFGPLTVDGVFQSKTRAALVRFQKANGLNPDGVAGPRTHEALMPWYTGYRTHTLRRGDTFYRLAAAYGTTVAAIETANPTADPLRLPIGGKLTIPLPFPVVSTQVRWFSEYTRLCCRGLTARYPALASTGEYGRSVLEQPLWQLTLGNGKNRVLYNASHHANEWITTPLLLTFAEQLLAAAASGGTIFDYPAAALLQESTLLLAPAVNPDGIDLVTGALENNAAYLSAFRLSRNYPDIPFPDGWKANIQGVDLNLQYPAGWSTAKSIKFAQGFGTVVRSALEIYGKATHLSPYAVIPPQTLERVKIIAQQVAVLLYLIGVLNCLAEHLVTALSGSVQTKAERLRGQRHKLRFPVR